MNGRVAFIPKAKRFEALLAMVEAAPGILAAHNARRFIPGAGHSFLELNEESGQINVVFFDGAQHRVIETELMPGQTAESVMPELHQYLSAGKVASANGSDPPRAPRSSATAQSNSRTTPEHESNGGDHVIQGELPGKAAQAYGKLASHFKVRGKGRVPASNASSVLTVSYGSSTPYFLKMLRDRGLLESEGDVEYLLEANITIRDGRSRGGQKATPKAPKPQPVPSPARKGNGRVGRNSDEDILDFFNDHHSIVSAAGILDREDSIGETISQAENFRDQLDRRGLALTETQGRYAISRKENQAPPQRKPSTKRGRTTAKKRR